MKSNFRNGFRIVGGCFNERRLVDSNLAFEAYADCDSKAGVDGEAYLSAYCFGNEFAEHLNATGSTKSYSGPTWSEWLWFDIDRDNLETAQNDTIRLVEYLIILAPDKKTKDVRNLKHLKSRHGDCRDIQLRFRGANQSFAPIVANEPSSGSGELTASLSNLWNTTETSGGQAWKP